MTKQISRHLLDLLMALLVTLLVTLFASLVGCSGDTSSSSGSSVVGANFSGTWTPLTLECWDPEFSGWTALAVMHFTSAPSNLVISGNTASYQIGNDICLAKETHSVIFNINSTQGDLSIGSTEEADLITTTASEDSCVFNQLFQLIPGSDEILPLDWTLTFNHRPDDLQTRSQNFVWDQTADRNRLGFQIEATVSGRPEDVCFLVYEKVN